MLLLRLGNDVVDLSLPDIQQKYLDQRFLQRVFAQSEQHTILSALNKSKVFWSIWAAKEAAYKACRKQFPKLVFAHQKFVLTDAVLMQLQVIEHQRELMGVLHHNNLSILVQWHWAEDYVHCLGVLMRENSLLNPWLNIKWNIAKIDINQDDSFQTRRMAKQFLLTLNYDPLIEIIRIDDRSPPTLWLNKKLLVDHEISLSHDGQFAAVAVLEHY